jgi:mono/diheme cytochrome c family protein
MRFTVSLFSTIVAGTIAIASTAAPAMDVDVNAAKQQFSELCARCHGPQGFGDGPDGGALSTRPRNFHDCAIMARDPDEKVFREVKGGSASIGRSNDMPAWGAALEDNEIRSLIAYVRTFCQQK